MSKKIKIIIAVLIVAILSVPISILIMDNTYPKDKIYDGVQINGTSVGELTKSEAIELLEGKYNNTVKNKKIEVIYEPKEFLYEIDYNSLNAHYDIETAVKTAMNYGKDGNAFNRVFTRFALKGNPENIKLKFLADNSRISEDVKAISEKVNEKAKNATISFNGSFSVTDEKDGLTVDQKTLETELKKSINEKKRKEIVNVPVNVEKPKITAEALRTIDTKMGEETTKFDSSATARASNIGLASSSINGSVIMPGEVFSTSKAMGPRVKSGGYKEAPVIVSGSLTPGLGGGVCQVSSTLYNAILKSDLEIVERRAHSLRVKYLPASRDAVISEDYIDLKFKNNTEYPVYIAGYTSGSEVTMCIYGSSKLPKKSVEITSEVYQTKPGKDGKTETKSRAYKKVYDGSGKLIKNEKLSDDHYKG